MKVSKRFVGVAIMVALVVISYKLYAWIGEFDMLKISLLGMLYVAATRLSVRYSESFRNSYFPAIVRGMGIKASHNVKSGIKGMWVLSFTGFLPLAFMGWWLVLVTHVVMVWLIIDDVKVATQQVNAE